MPTDKDYTLYLEVRNKKRIKIFDVSVEANKKTIVSIFIPANLTDLLSVPNGADFQEYYYALKICNQNEYLEDTLILDNKEFGDDNIMIVYPKTVEGIE